MNLQEVNNLADDPASVSWPVKILVLLVLMGFILFLGYKLVIAGSIEQLAGYESREQELRSTFETKQRRASQLKVYEAQLEEMQHTFGNLVQQLPSDTEIPALILDISEKGVSNGLEIELFEPLKEEVKEFYAEKPIKLIAMGTYRELATFVSDISGLPRIVTIHNIGLTPEEDKNKGKKPALSASSATATERGRRLRMEALIKTYRYLEGSDFTGQLAAGKS
ncbi:MAG TPA: type 4a pilus biogenesis protein PilO [Thiolinea sp.]|nr:type 4a pilus biogenesis protein PilO [Thiolinea sp.]